MFGMVTQISFIADFNPDDVRRQLDASYNWNYKCACYGDMDVCLNKIISIFDKVASVHFGQVSIC